MRQYEELVDKQRAYSEQSVLDGITIPVGPRLGNKVSDLVKLKGGDAGKQGRELRCGRWRQIY